MRILVDIDVGVGEGSPKEEEEDVKGSLPLGSRPDWEEGDFVLLGSSFLSTLCRLCCCC